MIPYHRNYTGIFNTDEFSDLVEDVQRTELKIHPATLMGVLDFIIDSLKQVNSATAEIDYKIMRSRLVKKLDEWQNFTKGEILLDLFVKHNLLKQTSDDGGKTWIRCQVVDTAAQCIAYIKKKAKAKQDPRPRDAQRQRKPTKRTQSVTFTVSDKKDGV